MNHVPCFKATAAFLTLVEVIMALLFHLVIIMYVYWSLLESLGVVDHRHVIIRYSHGIHYVFPDSLEAFILVLKIIYALIFHLERRVKFFQSTFLWSILIYKHLSPRLEVRNLQT